VTNGWDERRSIHEIGSIHDELIQRERGQSIRASSSREATAIECGSGEARGGEEGV
jgi:hypothetical protein